MNSYRQSNVRRGRRSLILATTIVVLLFAVDGLSNGSIRTLVRASGVRVWSASSSVASALGGSGFFSSRRALLEENEVLKQEAARLTLRVAALEALESENAALRTIVRVAEDLPGITASIVSSRVSSPYGTFMVGAGRIDGVAAGDLVVAGGERGRGFVIGRVSEVSDRLSLVTQVFAPNASVEAMIRDVPLLVEGQGGGNARAEAPRALSIAEGDTVISLHFRGMAIGVVGSVSRDTASAYQKVYIGLPVNLTTLQFVYVISPNP
ncbi:MAG: rod shape-determining protein MreC [bacterium]|nr:rod shape-determining protein MreC [bacterium]